METQELSMAAASKTITPKISEAVDRAIALTVSSFPEYESAVKLSLAYKTLEREIQATFEPIKSKAKAVHSEVCEQERKHLGPVQEAMRLIDSKAIIWATADKVRRERERREAEALAKKQEEDMRLAQAEYLAKNGNNQEAEALLDKPIVVSVPRIEVPKVDGFFPTTIWQYEIVNPDLLSREYLAPNLVKIGQAVRAFRENTSIPGIRVFKIESARKTVR